MDSNSDWGCATVLIVAIICGTVLLLAKWGIIHG